MKRNKLIDKIKKLLEKYFDNIKPVYQEISSWDDINVDVFDDWNKRAIIDSFIFNFIKIQDIMGDKLFKESLHILKEYKNNMSFIDVINKLEKLEFIEDANNWKDYRDLRNDLTHEYPDNYEDVILNLRKALNAYQHIYSIYKNIIKILDKYEA